MKPIRGDRYFPAFGDPSIRVEHYDIDLTYQVERNQLRARAVVRLEALAELKEITLDLRALRVTKVRSRDIAVARFGRRGHKLVVKPRKAVAAGSVVTLEIDYGGQPVPVPDGDDVTGWEELEDGVIVAGQTNGASSWFPCNDVPYDKATYAISVTTPSAYAVVANGELVRTTKGAGSTRWEYVMDRPMATYLATIHIGRYVSVDMPGARVPVRVWAPDKYAGRLGASFGRQSAMMNYFEGVFGPYPFDSYAVVITDDELEIPLEAQGLSAFGSNYLDGTWESVRLVAHELSHQWFGNSLTLRQWKDIWLHEGFACYAEWLWSGESGGPTTHERAVHHWRRLAAKPADLVLGDPGPDVMFDDRVYKRGALTLHALRRTIGDEPFFALIRRWVSDNAYGTVTTKDFRAMAEEISRRDLHTFFRNWLEEKTVPQLPG